MRVARCHPLLGWLRLDGHTYSRTLDQSLRERDRALELDRNHSGHAEGFVDWVWTTQLPELVRKESYSYLEASIGGAACPLAVDALVAATALAMNDWEDGLSCPPIQCLTPGNKSPECS